jgi:DNA-binding transcriptional MerR regulator
VDGLLSISEFAEYTGIPRSKLIYYDDIGLFSPVDRGENNYRYYSPMQIIQANLVTDLGALGVPLKVIKHLTDNRTPETILDILVGQKEGLNEQIAQLRDLQKVIDVYEETIKVGLEADENAISSMELDSYPLTIGLPHDFIDGFLFYQAFLKFCNWGRQLGINLSYPVGGMFLDAKTFFAHPSQPENFYFVCPDGKQERPKGTYLVGYTRGYYGDTGNLPQRMETYAKKHKLKLGGPVFNTYLHDEISIKDPSQYLLRAVIPIL